MKIHKNCLKLESRSYTNGSGIGVPSYRRRMGRESEFPPTGDGWVGNRSSLIQETDGSGIGVPSYRRRMGRESEFPHTGDGWVGNRSSLLQETNGSGIGVPSYRRRMGRESEFPHTGDGWVGNRSSLIQKNEMTLANWVQGFPSNAQKTKLTAFSMLKKPCFFTLNQV